MVYSKKRHEHLMHLKHIFDCWRKYGIALNLKKSVLMAIEDKLLGFVVLKDGINIELEIMEAIKKLTHLCSKNMMPPFLENISLLRHFVPSFVEIVKLLQDMIKKNSKFKWGPKEKESFSQIKESIVKSLALRIPNYEKCFILYTFASNNSYGTILTQKNKEGD